MSRNAKIALIVAAAFVVICIGGCAIAGIAFQRFGQQFANPQSAKQVGASIADYTLPVGYKELMGMDLLFYKMVIIAPENQQTSEDMVFMLMGTSMGATEQADMERQMQQAFQQQFNRNGGSTHVVGQEKVSIRGKETTLTIAETDSVRPMRQEVGAFQGENGLVMVMIFGDKAGWDDGVMREFLGSIQ